MKYKLLKDLPWAKAGTDVEIEEKCRYGQLIRFYYENGELMSFYWKLDGDPRTSDFFEPIEEFWFEPIEEFWAPGRYDTHDGPEFTDDTLTPLGIMKQLVARSHELRKERPGRRVMSNTSHGAVHFPDLLQAFLEHLETKV